MTSTEMSNNRLRNNLIAGIHAQLLRNNPKGVSDETLANAIEEYDELQRGIVNQYAYGKLVSADHYLRFVQHDEDANDAMVMPRMIAACEGGVEVDMEYNMRNADMWIAYAKTVAK